MVECVVFKFGDCALCCVCVRGVMCLELHLNDVLKVLCLMSV